MSFDNLNYIAINVTVQTLLTVIYMYKKSEMVITEKKSTIFYDDRVITKKNYRCVGIMHL